MDSTNKRPLGEAQHYVLSMVNPEWPTKRPANRSIRVLRTLEARGLVYENYGRWYISLAGQKVLDECSATQSDSTQKSE